MDQMKDKIRGLTIDSRKVGIKMRWTGRDLDVRSICSDQPQSLVVFR